jgi:hypothetical protein
MRMQRDERTDEEREAQRKAELRQQHREECRQHFRRPPRKCGRGREPTKWSRRKPAKHKRVYRRQERRKRG